MYRYYKYKHLPLYFMMWDWKDDVDYKTIIEYGIIINTLCNGYNVYDILTGGDDFCIAICDPKLTLEQITEIYNKIYTNECDFE